MPTQKPRVTFTISQEKLSEVEAYRFDHKIKNQTQAILSLIEKGLTDYVSKDEKTEFLLKLTPEETVMVQAYRRADDRTRQMVALALEPYKTPAQSEEAM